ncbi:MAG: hypothetical protein FWD31_14015, partial [Planctomycetaceae bacterium]|nr:hypothetical protein [Planctomycetaceae bacterium]
AIKQRGAIILDPETVEMHWVDPDTLEAVLPLIGEETLIATLSLQDRAATSPVTLSPVCLPYSPEFRPVEPGQGRDALAQLAETTQGRERIDLSQSWASLRRVPRSFDLTKWLLFVGMLCFLVEILQRRTGLVVAYWQRFVALLAQLLRLKQWSRVAGRNKVASSRLAAVSKAGQTHRDRHAESATDAESDNTGQKLSWWSRRKINREQQTTRPADGQGAFLMAKKRANDRTGDGRIVTQRPEQSATTAPSNDKSKSDKPAESESMFDALARARKAAKDRTKE